MLDILAPIPPPPSVDEHDSRLAAHRYECNPVTCRGGRRTT
jgi:hypothetical protein